MFYVLLRTFKIAFEHINGLFGERPSVDTLYFYKSASPRCFTVVRYPDFIGGFRYNVNGKWVCDELINFRSLKVTFVSLLSRVEYRIIVSGKLVLVFYGSEIDDFIWLVRDAAAGGRWRPPEFTRRKPNFLNTLGPLIRHSLENMFVSNALSDIFNKSFLNILIYKRYPNLEIIFFQTKNALANGLLKNWQVSLVS